MKKRIRPEILSNLFNMLQAMMREIQDGMFLLALLIGSVQRFIRIDNAF